MKNTVRANTSSIPTPSESQNGNRPELEPLIQEIDKLRRIVKVQDELRRCVAASNALSQLMSDFFESKIPYLHEDQIPIEDFDQFCYGIQILSKSTSDSLLAANDKMALAIPI